MSAVATVQQVQEALGSADFCGAAECMKLTPIKPNEGRTVYCSFECCESVPKHEKDLRPHICKTGGSWRRYRSRDEMPTPPGCW